MIEEWKKDIIFTNLVLWFGAFVGYWIIETMNWHNGWIWFMFPIGFNILLFILWFYERKENHVER